MTLKLNDLKGLIHRQDLTQRERLLLVLASFDLPCEISDIKKRAYEAGFRIPKTWNPSSVLAQSRGLAIKTPEGWEITATGKQYLANLGVDDLPELEPQRATDLREILKKLDDSEARSFLDEAIRYRSAWILDGKMQRQLMTYHA